MENIKSKIESLLFISGKTMSIKQLSGLINKKPEEIEEAGDALLAVYKEKNSGIQIIKNNSNYQMVTAGDNSELIKDFIKDETTGEFSKPSLETLTIIAYRGPVSKTDIDRIRGINCSLILKNLSIRGLVDVKKDSKEEETYYSVSVDFLRYLGINNVEELPEYAKLNQDDTLNKMLNNNEELPSSS